MPSRSSGVASIVRMMAPVRLMRDTVSGNSASAARMSSTWIVRRSHTTRPPTVSRLTGKGSPIASGRRSDPCRATMRRCSPSRRKIAEFVAPHTRAAFSTTASMTGWRSVGELAITRRISAVAVCCSSASFVSLNSRTFSMAITAWTAKVSSSSICLSENGWTTSRRITDGAERLALAEQRDRQDRPMAPFARERLDIASSASGSIAMSVNVDGSPIDHRPAGYSSRGLSRIALPPGTLTGIVPAWATGRSLSSSTLWITLCRSPRTAARALSAMVSNTGWTSVGERRSPPGPRSSPSAAQGPLSSR